MKDVDRISSFIDSFIADDEGLLGEIYLSAVERGVPVIRRSAREFLKTQLLIKKPKSILEIGTAIGYSSLFQNHNTRVR